jgi:hypothetical protein
VVLTHERAEGDLVVLNDEDHWETMHRREIESLVGWSGLH